MTVVDRLTEITKRIRAAERDAGRAAGCVSLMAVSKTRRADEIKPLLDAGHRLFGENRVQEALDKWPDLKRAFPDASVHLIGHLQKNKIKQAVAFFDGIDSVDSEELAAKIVAEMKAQNRFIPCFVQVNTGEEPQKSGVAPAKAVSLVAFCQNAGMTVAGLMCVPPVDDEPSPHFALLKKLARQAGVPQLSMGMSDDFQIAVEQGADIVRVGSMLFGPRS